MDRKTDKLLIEYHGLVTQLTFFNGNKIVYQKTIAGFAPLTYRLHDLAVETASGRNNLYLWPSYPTGSGLFIGRRE